MLRNTAPGQINSSNQGNKAVNHEQLIDKDRINKQTATLDLKTEQNSQGSQYTITSGDALMSRLANSIKQSMIKQLNEFREAQEKQIETILDQVKSLKSILESRNLQNQYTRNYLHTEELKNFPPQINKPANTNCQQQTIQQKIVINTSSSQKTPEADQQVISSSQRTLIEEELIRFSENHLTIKSREKRQLQLKIDDLIKSIDEKDRQLDHYKDLARKAKQSKQSAIKKIKKTREEYQAKIQSIQAKSIEEISNLKAEHRRELEERDLKLAHKNKHHQHHLAEQTHITSNSRFQCQKHYSFIEAKVQQFESRKIAKTDLLFQSDSYFQNFSNYLFGKEGQSFPLLILFYSAKKVLFGAYISHFGHKSKKDESSKKTQAFLFNASTQRVFFSSNSSKSLNPVIYSDGYLYFGNREVEIKNNCLKSMKVYCGCMLGEQYYAVGHREKLTCEEGEEILLDRVEIHRLHFENNSISVDTPTS